MNKEALYKSISLNKNDSNFSLHVHVFQKGYWYLNNSTSRKQE